MNWYDNYNKVMEHYNALYCPCTYNSVKLAVGEWAGDYHTACEFMTCLINASLECCGHSFYAGSVAQLFWFVRLFGVREIEVLTNDHLVNFAHPDYIEVLKGRADVQ